MMFMLCTMGGAWLLMEAVGGTHLDAVDARLRQIKERNARNGRKRR